MPSNSILFEETLHAENFMRMWLRPRFKLEIPAHIEHTTVSEAGAFKSDIILTQKTFADILTADASEEKIKRVVVLNKLTDKEEIETKIVAFLKERHLKVADYE